MTTLVLALHVIAGAIGVMSGLLASFVRKGGRLHRKAGDVFFVSMLVMAAFAAWLGAVMPGQSVNVFIAAFVSYLVSTAWMTVRRQDMRVGPADWATLVVAVALCAPFAVLSIQLAFGLEPVFRSAVPFKGPIVIAIFVFTAVLTLAVIGDARVVFAGRPHGRARLARHLWRMLLALTMALGSAFTNGLARLLPGPFHVPVAFFLPQLIPLALLVFWMIRMRVAERPVGHALTVRSP